MLSIKSKNPPKNGKTNKTLINNNTSFSGSFCLYAQKQKNPHKKNIFQPPKKWDRYQIVRKRWTKQHKQTMLHAGRYWNDKELRYLRIVIVTTSVSHSNNRTDTENISPLRKKNLDQNAMFLLTSRQAPPLNTYTKKQVWTTNSQ